MASPNPIIQTLDGVGVISYLLLSDHCVGEQGKRSREEGAGEMSSEQEVRTQFSSVQSSVVSNSL